MTPFQLRKSLSAGEPSLYDVRLIRCAFYFPKCEFLPRVKITSRQLSTMKTESTEGMVRRWGGRGSKPPAALGRVEEQLPLREGPLRPCEFPHLRPAPLTHDVLACGTGPWTGSHKTTLQCPHVAGFQVSHLSLDSHSGQLLSPLQLPEAGFSASPGLSLGSPQSPQRSCPHSPLQGPASYPGALSVSLGSSLLLFSAPQHLRHTR